MYGRFHYTLCKHKENYKKVFQCNYVHNFKQGLLDLKELKYVPLRDL